VTGDLVPREQIDLHREVGGVHRIEDFSGVPGCVWTGVSLDMPVDATTEDWLNVAFTIGRINTASKWALADLINKGEHRWGHKYAQLIVATGRSYDGLRAIARLGRQIPVDVRRIGLNFSHHEAVARLDRDDQIYWLGRAEDDRMDAIELRAHVDAVHPKPVESTDLPVIEQPVGEAEPPPVVEVQAPKTSQSATLFNAARPRAWEAAWTDLVDAFENVRRVQAGDDWQATVNAVVRLQFAAESAGVRAEEIVKQSQRRPEWA
jgi:hypothetical protein